MKKLLILMFLFFVLNCNGEGDNKMIEIIARSNANTISLGEEIEINIEIHNKSNESLFVCIDEEILKPQFSNNQKKLISEYGIIYSRSIEYPKEMFKILEKNEVIKFSYSYSLINDSIDYIENPYSGLILYYEIDEQNVLLNDLKNLEITSIYDCGSYISESFNKHYPNTEIPFFSTKTISNCITLSIESN